MPKILAVDDEATILSFLRTVFEREGYEVVCAEGGPAALQELEGQSFDVMVTDYVMEPMDGMGLLRQAHEKVPEMPVVMISGYCTVENAVEVLQAGAFDYLPKPVNVDEMCAIVKRALDYYNDALGRSHVTVKVGAGDLVVESPAMKQVMETIMLIAPTSSPALLLGEPGVGKQSIARAIHSISSRAGKAFDVVDCAGADQALQEHLFGASSGFQVEDGRILYLQEVGSLSSDSQSRLLKLLSEQDEQNDGYIRLLSSSSDPLEMMSSKGNFNAELFKRISMFKLSIPPFRERPEDVVGIATRMAQAGNPEAGIQLERDVELVLSHYAWPANGKELNEVMNGVLTKKDRPITVPMLPQRIVQMVGLENLRAMHQQSLAEYKGQALKNFLRDKEKQYLNNVLSSVGDNKEEAAKILDLQPDVLARHVSGDNA